MAQTNYTPISLYYSTTASAVPTAANLVQGELAINTNDGKLYYEDSSGVVQVLATKSTGSIGGSNTQVQFNNSGSLGGSSGLTWDGSFLTTSSIKNSALTSGRVTYAGASGLLSDNAGLTYNGASLTISSGASASALIVTSTSSGGTALNIQNNGTVNALIGGYLSCIGSGSATDVAIAAYQGALAFATNGANERMRIDSSGNLGVGETSPSSFGKLAVYGGSANTIVSIKTNSFDGTYYAGLNFSTGGQGANDPQAQIKAVGANNYSANLVFSIQNSGTTNPLAERMRIDSSGSLLVGTTTNNGRICATIDNSDWSFNSNQTGSGAKYHIRFLDNGTPVGSITSSGSVTSYNVTSDQRLKTNVVNAPSGNIDGIKVRSFDWIADGSHQEYGMVAQELIEVAPYAVTKPVNPDDMMQVDYSKLVPMMIKEIQDLKQRIATLENK